MNPLNSFYCVIIFIVAFLAAHFVKGYERVNYLSIRNESIDGLRGYLALGVFVHHSTMWFQYLQTDKWEAPKSNLYNQLGQTSVSLFFMISAFLFISKLIDSQERGFNWPYFFFSRVFRLVPMYFFSVISLFLLIMFISYWKINVELSIFVKSIINWCFFTIGSASIMPFNGSKFTEIIGGTAWSLSYEWLFYFSLPLASLFVLKNKPPRIYLIISVSFILLFYFIHGIALIHLASFLGGVISAIFMRYNYLFCSKTNDLYLSTIIIICFWGTGQFSTVYNIFCFLFNTIAFTAIVMGGTIFGLLKNSTLKFLGEISYSIYLLHSVLLFIIFYWGFGLENMKQFSAFQYSIIVFGITPLLVIISSLTYKYLEKPFLSKARTIFLEK